MKLYDETDCLPHVTIGDLASIQTTVTLIPSMSLRFVLRDGRNILQQCFHEAETGRAVWIDVPFVADAVLREAGE